MRNELTTTPELATTPELTAPAPPPPPTIVRSPVPTVPPPTYPPQAWGAPPARVKSGQSIASLVLGCVSILLYPTLIVPALAIIFGGLSISAQREARQGVNGMAVAGLVLGIIFLLIGVLFWLMITAGA